MRQASVTVALAALSNACVVTAHSYIWGVYLNGVDQGTFNGIRIPAFNSGPPKGYANSPVKDLDSIDMRCNVLGDIPVPHTILVRPGDNLTLDWHHDARTETDDVIADSHHGPIMVYLSPDPPGVDSFVKIYHKGKYEQGAEPLAPGKWATTSEVAVNGGHMNVRIPAGLKAGKYLLRAEMLALHEGDASFLVNPRRGAQFYPNCVQLEVTGDGTVQLPRGVSFPGAYKYDDPGVLHDVYCSTKTKTTTPCTNTVYTIPGPTVWEGAWAETADVQVGPVSGFTKPTRWSTWIVSSVVTSASFAGDEMKILGTSTYTASWPAATAVAATAAPTS